MGCVYVRLQQVKVRPKAVVRQVRVDRIAEIERIHFGAGTDQDLGEPSCTTSGLEHSLTLQFGRPPRDVEEPRLAHPMTKAIELGPRVEVPLQSERTRVVVIGYEPRDVVPDRVLGRAFFTHDMPLSDLPGSVDLARGVARPVPFRSLDTVARRQGIRSCTATHIALPTRSNVSNVKSF